MTIAAVQGADVEEEGGELDEAASNKVGGIMREYLGKLLTRLWCAEM